MSEIEKVIFLFKKYKKTLSLAESCTGGLLAATLCSYPGVSSIFGLGVIAYSNEMKNKLLKVKKRTLSKRGAVSVQVVREMAEGVLKLSGADFAISISGIAGPTGGTSEKPVGTVWFCVAEKNGGYIAKKYQFSGSRREIQKQAEKESWKILLDLWEKIYG